MENQWWLLLSSQACPIPAQLRPRRTRTKWWKLLKTASFKEMRLTKIWEGRISDMEKHPSQHYDYYNQNKKFVCNFHRKDWDSTTVLNLLLTAVCLNDSRIIIHYIMWMWVISLQVLMWRQPKDFWKLKLIMEENYLTEQIFSTDKTLFWKHAWKDTRP